MTRETDPDPQFAETYCVECLELPGAISQGDGIDEAIEMIKDAIRCWLEVAVKHGDPIPVGGTQVYNLAELADPPDYVAIVDVPIPRPVAA